MPKQDYYREQLKAEFETLFNSLGLQENQKQYLRARWMDQVLWMEGRASKARDWYYRLRLTTIIGGVIIPILVSLNLPENQRNLTNAIRYVTIGLGGIVAISSAVEEFFHYGERWRHYRRSVESLKAQGWQFSQLTGSYSNFTTHADAFAAFTLQIEDVIQRDVEIYATQVVNEQLAKKAEQNTGTPDYTNPAPVEYPAPAQLPSAEYTAPSNYSDSTDYGTATAFTNEPIPQEEYGAATAFTNEPIPLEEYGAATAFTNEPIPLEEYETSHEFTNEPLTSTDFEGPTVFTNEPIPLEEYEASIPSNNGDDSGTSENSVTETNPESYTNPA